MLEIHILENTPKARVSRSDWGIRITMPPEMSISTAITECGREIVEVVEELMRDLFEERSTPREFVTTEKGFLIKPASPSQSLLMSEQSAPVVSRSEFPTL